MAYTGYKIVTYMDVNPQSPTFKTTRTERVADSVNCGTASPNWVLISKYCEVDSDNTNTGYYVSREMDNNIDSPTYGNTRETKTYDEDECPLQGTEPNWYEDEENSYCELITYEPSHTEGYSGYKIKHMIDGNKYSPTHGQERWDRVLSEDCPAPNTEPQIEEISSSCVMVQCQGVTTTNGQKKIFGLDKNIYSSTYLQSMETIVTDTVNCPDGCGGGGDTYVFTWSDSSTTKTMNVTYEAQTVNVGVISTKNGSSQEWSVYSGTATKTSTGISVTLTENTSSSQTKTTSITLKQSESNQTIMLSIIQAKKTNTCTPSSTTYYNVTSSSTNPSTVAANVTSSTLSWNYDEITDYIYADCSTSSTTQSGTSSTTVTFNENTSTSPTTRSGNKTWTGHKNRNGNTITIPWSVTQQGKVITDAFTFGDGTTAKTLNAASGNTTQTIEIISIVGGVATDLYSLVEKDNWIQYNSHTATGFTITIERNDTGSLRTGTLTLRQNATNDTITLTVQQTAGTRYAFTYNDGTTSKSVNTSFRSDSGSTALISTKDGNAQGWTSSGDSQWITIDNSNSSSLKWSVVQNKTTDDRSGTTVLTQNESLNEIEFKIVQQQYTGVTDGEIAFWNEITHEVMDETTLTNNTACPAGGPTTHWIWSNVPNAWQDFEITVSAPTGMIEWARFGTTYANRAKLDIYWSSHCDGTASRIATITFSTPASQTVLTYRVVQRHVRW